MKKQSEDNIKSILFVAWFIVTFVCAFAFSGSAYSELFIFGQAFFIFGLVAILSMDDISREDYLLFLFLLVGFTLIEISIVGMTKAEYLIKMIPSIITNSIILFGLLIIMFERRIKIKSKTKPKKRRLSDFKTKKEGKIILYQRSYRYNIRDLNLIKKNNENNVNLKVITEYINIKNEKDNFVRNLGIFFIIFGALLKLLFI